jgi:hypothetical protein
MEIIERNINTTHEARLRDFHFDAKNLKYKGRMDIIDGYIYQKILTDGGVDLKISERDVFNVIKCERCLKNLRKTVIICTNKINGRDVICGTECSSLIEHIRDDSLNDLFNDKWRFRAGHPNYMYKNIKINPDFVHRAMRPYDCSNTYHKFTLVRGITKDERLWFRFGPDRINEKSFWKTSKVLFTSFKIDDKNPDLHRKIYSLLFYFIQHGSPPEF